MFKVNSLGGGCVWIYEVGVVGCKIIILVDSWVEGFFFVEVDIGILIVFVGFVIYVSW